MPDTDVKARLTLLNDGCSLLPLLLDISDEVSNGDVGIKPNHSRPEIAISISSEDEAIAPSSSVGRMILC